MATGQHRQLSLPVVVQPSNQRLDISIGPDTTALDIVEECRLQLQLPNIYYLIGQFHGYEKHFQCEERLYNLLRKQVTAEELKNETIKFYVRKRKLPSGTLNDEISFQSDDEVHEKPNPNSVSLFLNGMALDQPSLIDSPGFSMNQSKSDSSVSFSSNPSSGGNMNSMTYADLCQLAERQKALIQKNNQLLIQKEQRLRTLKQQDAAASHKALNERLRVLRDRVNSEESNLTKLRQLRGEIEHRRTLAKEADNELVVAKQMFQEKEQELSRAVSKVEQLAKQLDELRERNNGTFDKKDLEKLREELARRQRSSEEKRDSLRLKKAILNEHQTDSMKIDKKLEELEERIRQRNLPEAEASKDFDFARFKGRQAAPIYAQIERPKATVEPFKNEAKLRPEQGPNNALYASLKEAVSGFARSQNNNEDLTVQSAHASALSKTMGYNVVRETVNEVLSQSEELSGRKSPFRASMGASPTPKLPPESPKPSPPRFSNNYIASVYTGGRKFPPVARKNLNPQLQKPEDRSSLSSTSSSSGESPNSKQQKINISINKRLQEMKGEIPPPDLIPEIDRKTAAAAAAVLEQQQEPFYMHLESDKVSIRSDNLRAVKRRSWASEHAAAANSSTTNEAEYIRRILMREHQKRATDQKPDFSWIFKQLPNTTATVNEDSMDVLAENEARPKNLAPEPMPEMIERPVMNDVMDEDEHLTSATERNEEMVTTFEVDPDQKLLPPIPTSLPPTKGILKRQHQEGEKSEDGESSSDRKQSRKIQFDPLALLLDASLEGELELVKKSAQRLRDVSHSNDEGITALHNAICAGHYEIVRFLVEADADVNAQDSDGWTPLHCAASCNNLPMVKFLVEHGACVFATTVSDHETPADKCEEDEDGFDGCSQFLITIQEKLGVMNGGRVYAAYDYEAAMDDELSFKEGDELVVIKRDDGPQSPQKGWWCARDPKIEKEGFVPRNYLALYPRLAAQRRLAPQQMLFSSTNGAKVDEDISKSVEEESSKKMIGKGGEEFAIEKSIQIENDDLNSNSNGIVAIEVNADSSTA